MESALRKLKAAKGKGAQGRIDSFFTLQPKAEGDRKTKDDGDKKRKAAPVKDAKKVPAAKKAKK